jgi:hypothetical protein
VTFNFASQNRAVTIGDYYSLIQKMPGQFGVPAKVGILENNNKINIIVLSQDNNGKMTQNVPKVLKDNVAAFLSNFRMLNDYVSVDTGKVIDLSFEIYISIAKNTNQNSIISDVVTKVSDYMLPQNREFDDDSKNSLSIASIRKDDLIKETIEKYSPILFALLGPSITVALFKAFIIKLKKSDLTLSPVKCILLVKCEIISIVTCAASVAGAADICIYTVSFLCLYVRASLSNDSCAKGCAVIISSYKANVSIPPALLFSLRAGQSLILHATISFLAKNPTTS